MSTRVSKSKTETNATLLKSLLKLPGNKFCCDCKTADHPRWASWNLGIFLCIRCSGIHRSMGTHISRVKSVDLDAWTDEQAQSMVKWGNTKANKYWEAKLDASHVPSEGKIDNFVKTKYVSRRWVSAEERPDPDDLSDAENDAPIQAVKPASDNISQPATTARSTRRSDVSVAKVNSAPQQPIDSLLGLDFVSPTTSQAPRPAPERTEAITRPTTSVQSNLSLLSSPVEPASVPSTTAPRNDLKMSIMSLYASAPKPQQNFAQSQQTGRYGNTSGSSSSIATPSASTKPASAFDDLNGLFGGMNVAAAAQPQRSQYQHVQPVTPSYSTNQSSLLQAHKTAPVRVVSQPATDPWKTEEDSWGGFQGTQATAAQTKAPSAFDDLYSTSDVWK